MSNGRRIAAALLASAIGACAPVKPWQRGDLARPCMTPKAGEGRLASRYRAKLIETTTGGGLPGEPAGGGCGCTQ